MAFLIDYESKKRTFLVFSCQAFISKFCKEYLHPSEVDWIMAVTLIAVDPSVYVAVFCSTLSRGSVNKSLLGTT